jgi:hypothetical protein
MDRIIEVKVCGNHITKDNKYAGVQGEANVTQMRITFDEGWDGFSKTITFFNAYGNNPVSVLIVTPENPENIRTYLVAIPMEPLMYAGTMTFVLDGTKDDKIQRSVSDELEVKDCPATDGAVNAKDPTTEVVKQLQEEIAKINEGINEAYEAKESIQNMTVSCETLAPGAEATVNKSENDGIVNLHYGIPEGEKGDTGDSGVYIGDTEPTDPVKNVWIAPTGQPNYPAVVASDEWQADVLKIKNDKGEWINIPAITGESAYELAVRDGFSGTEEEWLAYITPSVKEVSDGIEVTVGDKKVFVANGTDGKDGEDGKTVTKMSELTNDMEYLRKNDKVSELTNDMGYLYKNELNDFNLEARGFTFSGDHFVIGALDSGMSVSGNIIHAVGTPEVNTDAANKGYVDKKVPTKVSELENDAGYLERKEPTEGLPLALVFDEEMFMAVSKGIVLGGAEGVVLQYLGSENTSISLDSDGIRMVSEKGVKIFNVTDDEASVVNKGYVDGLVGNVESALDSILAMQNSLIGGDA